MTWIKRISDGIDKVFNTVRPALTAIPPLLLICEVKNRPGLSAIALTAAIIRRLPEAGIDTGVNNDGSPNMICQFVRILSEEFVRELKDNAKITTVLQGGTVNSVGSGANAGGPFVVNSVNTIPITVDGILQ